MVTPESIQQLASRPASPCEHVEVARRRPAFRGGHRQRRVRGPARACAQHQLVYAALGDRMREEIHALSMKTLTPEAMAAAPAAAWTSSIIEGGAPLAARSRVSGAKNAALPILCAALLTAEPLDARRTCRICNDVRTMRTLLAQMGVASTLASGRHVDARRRAHRLAARALRAREDDARVDPRARARCSRAAARRACRCPAAARSGCGRSTSTSRACRRWAPTIDLEHGYIDARAARLQRRADRVRHRHRHRHREPDDGGDARRRHDGARERRARARGRRPRALPRSRWARRSRAPAPTASRSKASQRLHGATHRDHARPHRDRARSSPRSRRRGGDVDAHAARDADVARSGARQAARGRRAASTIDGDAIRVAAQRRARARSTCAPRRIPAFPTDMQAQFMALDSARRRHGGHHRDDLREPHDARAGAGAPRRRHRGRRQHGDRARACRG